MKLSQKTKHLTPSATLLMNSLAKARAKEGLPVFNLSAGEPDFPTPEHIGKAAAKAIEEGVTRYTPVGGFLELKEAILKRESERVGVDFQVNQVTCSNGGKQILYNLFQVLLNEGDEVLCFSPYWLSYKTQVELAGGILVEMPLSPEDHFAFDPNLLEQSITPKSKVLILNSPCNPSGQVLSKFDLEHIAEVVKRHQLIVISDDVYWHFNYSDEPLTHLLQVDSVLANRTFIVNSVSKSYCMTGWRLGWAIGPHEVVGKMEMLQGQSASNPSSITQMAAMQALNGPQNSVKEMAEVFAERQKKLMEWMGEINEKYPDSTLLLAIPEGAFYALINIRSRKKNHESDVDFCMALLRETGVAVTPGQVFGSACTGFVRISFAAADEVVKGALERLGRYRVN